MTKADISPLFIMFYVALSSVLLSTESQIQVLSMKGICLDFCLNLFLTHIF